MKVMFNNVGEIVGCKKNLGHILHYSTIFYFDFFYANCELLLIKILHSLLDIYVKLSYS